MQNFNNFLWVKSTHKAIFTGTNFSTLSELAWLGISNFISRTEAPPTSKPTSKLAVEDDFPQKARNTVGCFARNMDHLLEFSPFHKMKHFIQDMKEISSSKA